MHLNKFEIIPRSFQFAFEARTSRGKMERKNSWLIKVTDGERTGWGECSTIPGLSEDGHVDYSTWPLGSEKELNNFSPSSIQEVIERIPEIIPAKYPALIFGLETAFLDLLHPQPFQIFDNGFYDGKVSLPINGLVWMGDYQFMVNQLKQKIEQGFHCIKIKVGAIDFEQECEVLEIIRSEYSSRNLVIRLDANGAFTAENVNQRMYKLAIFDIHSIEQPLQPGDPALANLLQNTPIPIALDEELIGIHNSSGKDQIMELNPHYIILKPSLMGGISGSASWIEKANSAGIGWWNTSALESSIGLNAIAQFTAEYNPKMPQGLGTGQIFTNNIVSPLVMEKGKLTYNSKLKWKLD